MQINGIAQQLLAPLGFDRNSSSSNDSTQPGPIKIVNDDIVTRTDGGAFHRILSRYDVTNITPGEFSNLVQELHEAGEIDDAEFRELAKMRLELEQSGVPVDEPMDLVDFFGDKLQQRVDEYQNSRAADPLHPPTDREAAAFTAEVRRQLEWVRKFALVSDSGAEAIDLGA